MSTLMQKDSIALYKKNVSRNEQTPVIVNSLTDEEYKNAFMSQHQFSLSTPYKIIFQCEDFCNLEITIPPQIIQNHKSVDTIKQIFKSICETEDISTFRKLSITVFDQFFETNVKAVKNLLTVKPDIVINKLFNNAEINMCNNGINFNTKFQVCQDYVVKKDTGSVSIEKFKELNGKYPCFNKESWKIIQKNKRFNINLQGEAYLV